MLTWLKDLLAKIPPSIEKPLWALIVAVLTFYAAKYGILIPPAVNNVIVSPDADAGFLAIQGAAPKSGHGFHPMVHPLVRAHLALALEQRDGIGFAEAFAKVRKVSRTDLDDAIAAASIKLGVYGQLGDGTFLQKIIDFLNSPQGQALIKFLLTLLAAFAEPAPQHAMLWDPVGEIQTCQVPYPLAWTRPVLSLAC